MQLNAILAAAFALFATTAEAQFVANGGQAGDADASAFGQASSFANQSTTFDGVEFRLKRLIRDPQDPNKLRLVADVVNVGEADRWIMYFLPYPTLVDELGNTYEVDLQTGIDACRSGDGWTDYVKNCDSSSNMAAATKLSPGVPTPTMLRMAGIEEKGYDAEMAGLATYTSLRIRFIVSPDGFDDYRTMQLHDYIVPNIPLPR